MFRIIRIRQRSVRRSWRDPVASRSYRQLNMVSDNLPSVIPLRQPTADPHGASAWQARNGPLRELRPLKAEVKPEAVKLILNSTSAVRCAGKDQNAECGSAYISTPARPRSSLGHWPWRLPCIADASGLLSRMVSDGPRKHQRSQRANSVARATKPETDLRVRTSLADPHWPDTRPTRRERLSHPCPHR